MNRINTINQSNNLSLINYNEIRIIYYYLLYKLNSINKC